MKTKLLVPLFAFVLFSVAGMAQGGVPIFQLGVKGGVNITKIDGKSFSDEFNYGYHAGAFATIKITNHIQIQPEVLFNQINTKADTAFGNVLNVKNLKGVKLNYVSIPLLLNITPAKIISFQFGPQFGILLDKHKNLFENGKDAFSGGDLSLLAGAQLNLGSIRVSGRYVVGVANINDASNSDKWKNQGFQLGVGFRII
ncbi:MAG TPA: porin family protein [Chitinophagaceae bacterium]|nr:porin family protein [Chitinophagaceae bacterium]